MIEPIVEIHQYAGRLSIVRKTRRHQFNTTERDEWARVFIDKLKDRIGLCRINIFVDGWSWYRPSTIILGAYCHSLDHLTGSEDDPATDDAIHGIGERGEATSGGAVFVAFLALAFALAVVALFRHWHVDIGWLFAQFGR